MAVTENRDWYFEIIDASEGKGKRAMRKTASVPRVAIALSGIVQS